MKLPVARVAWGGRDEVEVQITGGAQVRWEQAAMRNDWGRTMENPTLWAAYVSYESMRVQDMLPEKLTFDEFLDRLDYAVFGADGEEVEEAEVDPTRKGTLGD